MSNLVLDHLNVIVEFQIGNVNVIGSKPLIPMHFIDGSKYLYLCLYLYLLEYCWKFKISKVEFK